MCGEMRNDAWAERGGNPLFRSCSHGGEVR